MEADFRYATLFDPTRKATSKKNEKQPQKKKKNEDDLKKNDKKWRRPQIK